MTKAEGIDNKAFEGTEKASGKPLTSFGNGNSNGLNDSGANGANKNGQLNEKKLAGEILSMRNLLPMKTFIAPKISTHVTNCLSFLFAHRQKLLI
jgi:hypothetical protein